MFTSPAIRRYPFLENYKRLYFDARHLVVKLLVQEISDGMYSSSEEFPLFQSCKENVEPDKVRKWRKDLKNFKKRLKYGTGAGASFV